MPDGPRLLTLRVQVHPHGADQDQDGHHIKHPEEFREACDSVIELDIDLKLELPYLRLSDAYTGASVTNSEIVIDCGTLYLSKCTNGLAKGRLVELSNDGALPSTVHPDLLFDTVLISNIVGDKHVDGISILVEKSVDALKEDIRVISRAGQLTTHAVRTLLRAHAIDDAYGLTADGEVLESEEFEAWLDRSGVKAQLTQSEIVACIGFDTALGQCFLPFAARVGSNDLTSLPTVDATIALSGFNFIADLAQIDVLASVTGVLGRGTKAMNEELGLPDWPRPSHLVSCDIGDLETFFELGKSTVPTESSAFVSASAISKARVEATKEEMALGFDIKLTKPIIDEVSEHSLDHVFSVSMVISRARRPVISYCIAIELQKLRSIQEKFEVAVNVTIQSAVVNVNIGHWEPLIEPWRIEFLYSSANSGSELELSAEFLQINLTYSSIQDTLEVLRLLGDESGEHHDRYAFAAFTHGLCVVIFLCIPKFCACDSAMHDNEVGFAIQNHSGLPLEFRLCNNDGNLDGEFDVLLEGQLTALNPQMMAAFNIGEYSQPRNIEIRAKGSRGTSQVLQSVHLVGRGTCEEVAPGLIYHVFESATTRGCKVLEFCSAMRLSNVTDVGLQIRISQSHGADVLIELPAGELNLPLPVGCLGETSELQVRVEQEMDLSWSAPITLVPSDADCRQSSIRPLRCQTSGGVAESFYCHFKHSHAECDKSLLGTVNELRTLAFCPCLVLENLLPFAVRLRVSSTSELLELDPGETCPLPCIGTWAPKADDPVTVAIELQSVDRLTATVTAKLMELFDEIDASLDGEVSMAEISRFWHENEHMEQLLGTLPDWTGRGTTDVLKLFESRGDSLTRRQFMDCFRFARSTTNWSIQSTSNGVELASVLCYHQGLVCTDNDMHHFDDEIIAASAAAGLFINSKRTLATSSAGSVTISDCEVDALKASRATSKDAVTFVSEHWNHLQDAEPFAPFRLPLRRNATVEPSINMKYNFPMGGDITLTLWAPLWICNRFSSSIACSIGECEISAPRASPSGLVLQPEYTLMNTEEDSELRLELVGGDNATTKVIRAHSKSMVSKGSPFADTLRLDEIGTEMLRLDLSTDDGSEAVKRVLISAESAPAPFSASRIITIRSTWIARNCTPYDLAISRSVGSFVVLCSKKVNVVGHSHGTTLHLQPGDKIDGLAIQPGRKKIHSVVCFVRGGHEYWCPTREGKGLKSKAVLSRIGDKVVARYKATSKVPVFPYAASVNGSGQDKTSNKIIQSGQEVNALDVHYTSDGMTHLKVRLLDGGLGWVHLDHQFEEISCDTDEVDIEEFLYGSEEDLASADLQRLCSGEERGIFEDAGPVGVADAIKLAIGAVVGAGQRHNWSLSLEMPKTPGELLFRVPASEEDDGSSHKYIRAVIPSRGIVIFKNAEHAAPYALMNCSANRLEYKAKESLEPGQNIAWSEIWPGQRAGIWSASKHMQISVRLAGQPDDSFTKEFDAESVGSLPAWECAENLHLLPSVLICEGAKTLQLNDETPINAHSHHEPRRQVSSSFIELKGFQLSVIDKNFCEWARLQASNFNYTATMAGMLHVTVLKAEGLPSNLTGTNDAYCVLIVDGETRHTTVKTSTRQPVWSESHSLENTDKYQFHFCARDSDRLSLRIFDHNFALDDALISECAVRIDTLPQLHEHGWGLHGAVRVVPLHSESEPAGVVHLLLAYEAQPVTQPELVKLSCSAIVLSDRLDPAAQREDKQCVSIFRLGGQNGISVTMKRCLTDSFGQPVIIPHLKALRADCGKLHLQLNSRFLHAACNHIASVLPMIAVESFATRATTARTILCELAINHCNAIPQILAETEPGHMYCEGPRIIDFCGLDVELVTDIDEFVSNILTTPSLLYICRWMGTDLAYLTDASISKYGVKIGLVLLSKLVSFHLSASIEGMSVPLAGERGAVVTTEQLTADAYSHATNLNAKLVYAVLKAVTPNPFGFLTSRVRRALQDSKTLVMSKLYLIEEEASSFDETSKPRRFGPDGELLPRGLAAWYPGCGIAARGVVVRGGQTAAAARLQILQGDYRERLKTDRQQRIANAANQQEIAERTFAKEEGEAIAAEAAATATEETALSAEALAVAKAADAMKAVNSAQALAVEAKVAESASADIKSQRASDYFHLAKEKLESEAAGHEAIVDKLVATVAAAKAEKEAHEANMLEETAERDRAAALHAASLAEYEQMQAELATLSEQKATLSEQLAQQRAVISAQEVEAAENERLVDEQRLSAAAKKQFQQESLAQKKVNEANELTKLQRIASEHADRMEEDAKAAVSVADCEQLEADAAAQAAQQAEKTAAAEGTAEALERYTNLAAIAEKEIAEAAAAKVEARHEQDEAIKARKEADAAIIAADASKAEAQIQHNLAVQAKTDAENARVEAESASRQAAESRAKADKSQSEAKAAEAGAQAARKVAAEAAATAEAARTAMEAQQAEAARAEHAAATERAAADAAAREARLAGEEARAAEAKAVTETREAAEAVEAAARSREEALEAQATAEQERQQATEAAERARVETLAAESAASEAREARGAAEVARELAFKERDEADAAKKEMEAAAAAAVWQQQQELLPHPPPRDGMLAVKIVGCSGLIASDLAFGVASSDPYCKISIGEVDKKGAMRWLSTTIKASMIHPRFDESFTFLLREGTDIADCTIYIEVYDSDPIGSDDFLGQVEFDCADAFRCEWHSKVVEERVELSDPHNKVEKVYLLRQKKQMAGTMIGDGAVYGHLFLRCAYYMDTEANGTTLGRQLAAFSSPQKTRVSHGRLSPEWPAVQRGVGLQVQYRVANSRGPGGPTGPHLPTPSRTHCILSR
jgi:hypothetical protein